MEYHLLATIFSAIDTSTYKLAKVLFKFLTPSISNKFTVIDSFHFAVEICQQDSNLHMASLDVDLYLLIFPYRKPSTFVLITCTMRIPLTSQSMIFMICLTQQPKKLSLSLTANIINKQMVQLWDLYWVQPQLTFSYAILKVNGFEIALMISNLCSIDVILMIYLYCFLLLIMQIILFLESIPSISKKTLSPFKVVYHPVSCLLHPLTHVTTKRVPIITNLKRPIYQAFN